MSLMRPIFAGLLLSGLVYPQPMNAQTTPAQTPPTADQAPTIVVNSRLVFLDVTVLDKKGNPVVTGLAKKDFTITQDRKPRSIFSFEPPETHLGANEADDNPSGKAPITVFVLDQLNSTFEQMAYIRYCVHKYLAKQPARLSAPAEVMVLGNRSLEMVQAFTRNKADLLSAVDHLPGAIPYKLEPSFFEDRFEQSIEALQEIALQNSGIPGRKNIVWVGHGGPSLYLDSAELGQTAVNEVNQFVHQTTNMLVDSRMSLFVIYPGLQVRSRGIMPMSELSASADIGDSDPFAGDVNFGVFVNATGGKLFFNRNDIDAEIQSSENLGSHYYTLTYQPPHGESDGRFTRIRVNLSDRSLRAVTKAGYFAPDSKVPIDPQAQANAEMVDAAHSTLSFGGLSTTATAVAQHPDTHTGDFKLDVRSKNIDWQPIQDGNSATEIDVLAVSLSDSRDILAFKDEALQLTAHTQDPTHLIKVQNILPISLRIPRKTRTIRFVLRDPANNRMGTVEVPRQILDGLPETPTPPPALLTQHRTTPPPPTPQP
jgi:VWFA-related protein